MRLLRVPDGVPPGAFLSQGRVQRVPVWLLVRRRSDRGRGGCYSRRGLRSAFSAGRCPGWLLLDAGLWSCWWFSPCLICGCSPRWNMDAAGNVGGGLSVWFFPIVSAGRCPVPSCKRKSLSGLIVGRAFVLSGGLIVWGCGCCTASSVGGWVSDLGCVGVCCACVRDAAGRSDRRCAGGAGRSVAGAAAGCGAADLCMISPGGVRWLHASERGLGACCGAARAGRLCGFGILPNKSLQRKGPCMYRAIACKSSVCINVCPACKC